MTQNTNGLFTVADLNMFLSPLQIIPIAHGNKYEGIFQEMFLILSWKCMLCLLIELLHWGNSNQFTQHTIIL